MHMVWNEVIGGKFVFNVASLSLHLGYYFVFTHTLCMWLKEGCGTSHSLGVYLTLMLGTPTRPQLKLKVKMVMCHLHFSRPKNEVFL